LVRTERGISSQDDPFVVDSIGVILARRLARERFNALVSFFIEWWARETKGDAREFARWLKLIRHLVS
jgi:hypothetical protein